MTRIVHALIFAVLAAALAYSQASTGRLAGTVLDPSGAAIPAAEVTVRSDATGAELELQTNAAGGFLAVSLLPGNYTVEVLAEGFKAHTIEAQKVDVARETSLPPIVLEIGAATEVVVVEGGVSQVQTTNAEVSSVVTADQMADLPLIGRNPLTFLGPPGRSCLFRGQAHCDQWTAHSVLEGDLGRSPHPGQLHSAPTAWIICPIVRCWTKLPNSP